MCVCARARERVRACVRAFVRACMHVRAVVRAIARARVCTRARARLRAYFKVCVREDESKEGVSESFTGSDPRLCRLQSESFCRLGSESFADLNPSPSPAQVRVIRQLGCGSVFRRGPGWESAGAAGAGAGAPSSDIYMYI